MQFSYCYGKPNHTYKSIDAIMVGWGLLASRYNDVILGAMASQVTNLTIVYSSVYSGIDQRKHQSSASLAFMRGIHRWPVNSPHKGPVTREMFGFNDVIMISGVCCVAALCGPEEAGHDDLTLHNVMTARNAEVICNSVCVSICVIIISNISFPNVFLLTMC